MTKVFRAEKVPSVTAARAAAFVAWPLLVATCWGIAETFHVWGLEGDLLDVRPIGLPLVLLTSLVLILSVQTVGVLVQRRFDIGRSSGRRYAFWASWTLVGALMGTVQVFANLPASSTAFRPLLLASAYLLAGLYGAALTHRLNN